MNIRKKITEKEFNKHWESLGISNDFIFCKVMQDEELLSELVHMILPELKFSKIVVISQKSVENGLDIRGVRFDLYVTDENGDIFVIEMQIARRKNLPKRMRYYEAMSDLSMLEKGTEYGELKRIYIILIAPFDPFGKGLHRYTFTNRCEEEDRIRLGDETTKIILNAKGTADDVDEKLKAFLNYVAGKPSEDEYVKKLDERVKTVKMNKEWRREYMFANQRDLENQSIGEERGIKKGIRKGRREGRKEGRKEGIQSAILDMLNNGKTPEAISEFCGFPIDQVREVQQRML